LWTLWGEENVKAYQIQLPFEQVVFVHAAYQDGQLQPRSKQTKREEPIASLKPDPKPERQRRREVLMIRNLFYDDKMRLAYVIQWGADHGWTAREVRDVVFYRTYKSLVNVCDGGYGDE
jgi:hypothetical protein